MSPEERGKELIMEDLDRQLTESRLNKNPWYWIICIIIIAGFALWGIV